MRVEPPFTCPVCKETREHPVRCPDCDEQVPLDARGRVVPLSRYAAEGGRTAVAATIPAAAVGGALVGGLALATGQLALLGVAVSFASAGVLGALGYAGATRGDSAARGRRQRAALLWGRSRAIGALSASIARQDVVTVRGRVRLLSPARGETGDVAARGSGLVGACGRFVVDDGTGLALVDDDAITVWRGPFWAPRADAIARDADEVLVVGPARPPSASERASLGAYRDGGALIVFDGSASRHVCVLVSSDR